MNDFHISVSSGHSGCKFCMIDNSRCLLPNALCTYCSAKKEKLKKLFPIGTRVVLDKMDDIQAPPVGTTGTVEGIDDVGDLLIRWDTGGSLKLIYGVNAFHRI